jgi:hypothetical protein
MGKTLGVKVAVRHHTIWQGFSQQEGVQTLVSDSLQRTDVEFIDVGLLSTKKGRSLSGLFLSSDGRD